MWNEIIVSLTEYVRQKYERFDLSMTSNGMLLDESKLEYMDKNSIGLLLSIDGDRESQDVNRPRHDGTGSFSQLEKHLDGILHHYPNVTFRSTVTPATCRNLYHNMIFAESRGFKNYFVVPNSFESWSKEEKGILAQEMDKYADHYIEKFRIGETPIIFGQMEKSFKEIRQRNRCIASGERRPTKLCQSCAKCGLGTSRFAGISVNGDIFACQELCTNDGVESPFYIGSIYQGVDDARREALAALYDQGEPKGDDCSSCVLDRICNGGCAVNHYLMSGNMHRVPDIDCEWSRILFRTAVKIMTILGEEENEAFRLRWGGLARG